MGCVKGAKERVLLEALVPELLAFPHFGIPPLFFFPYGRGLGSSHMMNIPLFTAAIASLSPNGIVLPSSHILFISSSPKIKAQHFSSFFQLTFYQSQTYKTG